MKDRQDENIEKEGNMENDRECCWLKCVKAIQGCNSDQIDLKKYAGRNGMISLIGKGNLIARDLDELPALNIMIEECIFRKTDSMNCYEAILDRVPGVYMRPEISRKKRNNLLVPERTIIKF